MIRYIDLYRVIILSLYISSYAKEGEPLCIIQKDYNFGKIIDKEKVSHEFEISNNGDETVVLELYHKSCDCTTVTLSSPVLFPGEQGILMVLIDLTGRKGNIEIGVSLQCDYSEQKIVNFRLTGFVCSALQCDPEYINLGDIDYGVTYIQRLKISSFSGKPLEINEWNSDNELFKIKNIVEGPDPINEKFAIIEIQPSQYGLISGKISFVSQNPMNTASAQIEAFVKNINRVNPEAIYLNGRENTTGTIEIPSYLRIEPDKSFISARKIRDDHDQVIYQFAIDINDVNQKRIGKVGCINLKDNLHNIVQSIPIFY